MLRSIQVAVLSMISLLFVVSGVGADEKLTKLIESEKPDKAVEYAEEKIPAADRSVDQWLQIGRSYEQIKNDPKAREKALNCYESALKKNPSDPKIFLAMGDFQYSDKKYADAVTLYQKSYMLSRTARAAEGIAQAAAKMKDWEKARDAAESAIALDSNVIEPRVVLSTILLEKKDYKSAAGQLEKIAAKRPDDVELWRKLAICYQNTADKEKLAPVDLQIVRLDKKDIKSRQRVAEHAVAANDQKTAAAMHKELAILTPTDPKPFKFLYEISLKEGNKKDAALYLKNFLVLDSTDASAHGQLGDLLYEAGDMDGALEAYRKAVKRDGAINGIYENYSAIVLKKGLEDEALRVTAKAIAAKETSAPMLISAGNIYKKKKDCASAIKMYQLALETNPKNLQTLSSIAECQQTIGDLKNAIQTYQQVVLLNPQATAQQKALGDLQVKSGKRSEGIETYKKYLEKVPTDQEVASTIGLHEYGQKQYKSAISFLSIVKESKLQTLEVLMALGDAHYQLQDCKSATASFEKVRALKPGHKALAAVLRPLAECYEKAGDDLKAADAYSDYVKIPSVKDADASYLQAHLREKSDKAKAISMYEANTKAYPRDYRSFLRLGLLYANEGTTLQQAAARLKSASVLVDTIAEVWQTLGAVYGKLRNDDGELSAYQKFLKLRPQDKTANTRVGQILAARKQYAPAITNLEIVLTTNPDDLQLQLLVADAYLKTNRPKEAVAHLRKARDLGTDNVSVRLLLIDALEKTGDKEGAASERAGLAQVDKKIIAADKKNTDSRQRLAEYSLAQGDTKTAFSVCAELATLTPKDAKVYKILYDIAISEGKKKEATGYLRKYLALKPDAAEGQKDLGNLLYEQKDPDGALEAYRAARKLDAAVKGIYKNYADIVISKKLDDEAVTVITAAIAAKEADARMYAALGDIYKKRGQSASAVKMYKGALETDTRNVSFLTSLAEAQAKNNEVKDAVVTYEQIILLSPNATTELKELGALHSKQGSTDQAMDSYRKYLDRVPTDEKLAKTVGTHEFGKKQYKSAIKYLTLVKTPELRTVDFMANLGTAYHQIGECPKATELFEKVWKTKGVSQNHLKEVLRPLGECHERAKQAQAAADAYGAYVALPGVVDPEIAYRWAFLTEKQNESGAIKIYTSNTKQFPGDHRNFLRLGTIYSRQKETHSLAAANLAAATKLVDTLADAWLALAQVNGNLGKPDGELAAYKRYLQLQPQNLAANRRVGELFLAKKQYPEAITNLEMVLTMKSDDVETMMLLMDAYESTNRHPKAVELLTKARELKPDDASVRERLYKMYQKDGQKGKAEAEIRELAAMTKDNKHRIMYFKDLIEHQKYDEASAVARMVRESDPLNFDGLMAVATAQRLQKKYVEAIESYKSALYVKETFTPALCGRAECHLAMGDFERATGYYEKALSIDSKLVAAELGLARVAKAQKKEGAFLLHLNKAKALDPNNKEVLEELKSVKK